MQPFLHALAFLTRLPVPAWAQQPDDEQLRRSVRWFPAVGVGVGAMTAGLLFGLDCLWSRSVAVLLALAFEARWTGALHEDALADCGDALGGGWTRERVLEIFKDSRLGTYGVLSLGLGVALRFAATLALMGSLPLLSWFLLVILAAGAGRLAIVIGMVWLPPMAERPSLAQVMGSGHTWRHALLASAVLWPLALALLVLQPVQLLSACALSCSVLFVFLRYVRRRLGGSTGDVLGAAAYLVQLAVLLGGCSFL